MPPQADAYNEERTRARERMVRTQIARRGITDRRVLDAMLQVPRHRFVAPHYRHLAYTDGPLPIGYEQTISQPYIVALMTQLLELTPEDRVLEIGVGSGYQTAILAEIVHEVVGVERIPELVDRASERLAELGYQNVTVHAGDGTLGWPETGPYDGILVAAASPVIPRPLAEQLADGGRLIIPVGDMYNQFIQRAVRHGEDVQIKQLTAVRFVPLVGRFGF